MGSLTDWPGVGRSIWASWRVQVLALASWLMVTATSGVPACRYQRRNWVSSLPVASAKQPMKSSIVAARPSWRLK